MGIGLKPSSTAMLDFFEQQSETLTEMVSEFRSGKYPTQPWKVVPAARLLKIWKDAAKDGCVRDVKGLAKIESIFVENVLRLTVNTEVAGHSHVKPEDILGEYFEPSEFEGFVDWAIDTPNGWRISDYGLETLVALAALVTETPADEDKLVILDRMLNVVHPRSDMASWFVEGGTRTLIELHDGERPSEYEDAQGSALPVAPMFR